MKIFKIYYIKFVIILSKNKSSNKVGSIQSSTDVMKSTGGLMRIPEMLQLFHSVNIFFLTSYFNNNVKNIWNPFLFYLFAALLF